MASLYSLKVVFHLKRWILPRIITVTIIKQGWPINLFISLLMKTMKTMKHLKVLQIRRIMGNKLLGLLLLNYSRIHLINP